MSHSWCYELLDMLSWGADTSYAFAKLLCGNISVGLQGLPRCKPRPPSPNRVATVDPKRPFQC
eukprot:1909419-Amphidinium_carterae.1